MNNVITLQIKNRRASIDRREASRRLTDREVLIKSLSDNLELMKEVKRLKAEIKELKGEV